MPASGRASISCTVLVCALLVGCGGSEPSGADGRERFVPDPARIVRIAVANPIRQIDPLFARNRAERLVARQIHEPLVSRQRGPFGQGRMRRGLVGSVTPSDGGTVWTLRLRRGVRFQDGTLLNASAVRTNVDRWLTLAPELLPAVEAVDSPQPREVRLLLAEPDPEVPRRLTDPRLGLASPEALQAAGIGPVSGERTGTGPFELREQDRGRTLLARNTEWWGSRFGLGPGTNLLELRTLDSAAARLARLASGELHVADRLDQQALSRLRRDPLLASVGDGEMAIGLQRSVRGIDSARAAQSLADVWLTDLR